MSKVRSVTIDIKQGMTIQEAIEKGKEIAKISESIVYFTFNGVELYVDDREIDNQFIIDVYYYLHYKHEL